jgi:hypothetical protein
LVKDVHIELQALPSWKFSFVKKEGNIVAHTLAKRAITDALDQTWHARPPDCIKETVALEQIALGT